MIGFSRQAISSAGRASCEAMHRPGKHLMALPGI